MSRKETNISSEEVKKEKEQVEGEEEEKCNAGSVKGIVSVCRHGTCLGYASAVFAYASSQQFRRPAA